MAFLLTMFKIPNTLDHLIYLESLLCVLVDIVKDEISDILVLLLGGDIRSFLVVSHSS